MAAYLYGCLGAREPAQCVDGRSSRLRRSSPAVLWVFARPLGGFECAATNGVVRAVAVDVDNFAMDRATVARDSVDVGNDTIPQARTPNGVYSRIDRDGDARVGHAGIVRWR